MAGWDEDSPQLFENLTKILREIRDGAKRRDALTLESARGWHRDAMAGLEVPFPECVGKYRGEAGLTEIHVGIGTAEGVPPTQVAAQLKAFEARLQRALAVLDRLYPRDRELDADGLAAAIDAAAWAHAEWVRIHPFANGNGRTARLWANAVFMRYGLPPAVRLRPRPDGGYAKAAAQAMRGNWRPTATVFREMLESVL